MGRLIHPSGDLRIEIEGIAVEGEELCMTGQMGVWKAKILLSPEEVAYLARFLFKPQLIRYMVWLAWKVLRWRLAR
jgi:hypothetical protein